MKWVYDTYCKTFLQTNTQIQFIWDVLFYMKDIFLLKYPRIKAILLENKKLKRILDD